jgi:hypothetical protein
MNNQSKFSLADVLTLLAALAFSFVCFLGTNFYTLGNITQSLVVAAIIFVLMVITAFSAKLLKRASRNFKTCFIWEMIFLVLFTGQTAFFAYSPFPHYFVVSEQKTEVQSKLATSITQAENMFAEYEKYAKNRENLYKNQLNSVVSAKNINPGEYAEYGFENNGIADSKQIENKMFTLHAELFPSNFLDMKHVDSTWLAHARKIVNSWKPIGIVSVVNEVEKNSNDWLNELIKLSAYRGKGEQADNFAYRLSFDDVKKHFNVFGKPVLLSVGLTVATYLLMLLSYFITKRSTKSSIGRGKNNGNGGFDVEF